MATSRPGWIEYPLIREPSAELRRNLTSGETLRINVRRHVMVLWKPAVLVLLLTFMLLATIAGNTIPSGLLLLAWLGALLWLGWSELERRHNVFVATDSRVLKIEGLIAKSVPVMKRGKVTDLRLHRSLIGRLVNYGTIVIESAGQEQALRELDYIRFPTEVFRRLNEHKGVSAPAGRLGAAARTASAVSRRARKAMASRRGTEGGAGGEPGGSPRHSPLPSDWHHDDTDEIPTYRGGGA